jgi:hypothetical protein
VTATTPTPSSFRMTKTITYGYAFPGRTARRARGSSGSRGDE